jgi:hypothetical protein
MEFADSAEAQMAVSITIKPIVPRDLAISFSLMAYCD